jgi:predicted ester cyclase
VQNVVSLPRKENVSCSTLLKNFFAMNCRIFHACSLLAFILLNFCHSPSLGQNTTLLNVNKKIVTRYFDEVINTQKLNRMGEFFSQDYIWHQSNGKDIHSSQDSSHVSVKRWLFASIPDIHYTIDHLIAEGDMVAVHTTATGTAKGEMFGLPAGQKKVRFKQLFFYKLKDNRITGQWDVVDLDGLKAQLAQK